MKYAIFSDIHGNVFALRAALSDAKSQGADTYIFLGDYANSFPWGNDVTDLIRGIEYAKVIRGNGEGYFEGLRGKPRDELTLEQFKPVYWAYHKLSSDHLEYLLSLPEKAELTDNGDHVYLRHTTNVMSPEKIDLFHSGKLCEHMSARFSRQEYLDLARNAVLSRADTLADIRKLPKGVYLYGHNHLQFHMEYEGRLFVNPGSCGEALDWDATAAYTLLEREREKWVVTERRAKYDLDEVITGLYHSGYREYAPMWSRVMELELITGKDYSHRFIMHLIDTGRRLGKTEYPVTNEVWDEAVRDLDISRL